MHSLHFCSASERDLQEGHDSVRIKMTVSWSQQLSLLFSGQLCDMVGFPYKSQSPATIMSCLSSFNMSAGKTSNVHSKSLTNFTFHG